VIIISDIVEANIPDTIANIKQKSLYGRYFKELEQPYPKDMLALAVHLKL
jgi:ACT domain-containing protein